MAGEVERNGPKIIVARAIGKFPHLFPRNYKACNAKVSYWWKQKDGLLALHQNG